MNIVPSVVRALTLIRARKRNLALLARTASGSRNPPSFLNRERLRSLSRSSAVGGSGATSGYGVRPTSASTAWACCLLSSMPRTIGTEGCRAYRISSTATSVGLPLLPCVTVDLVSLGAGADYEVLQGVPALHLLGGASGSAAEVAAGEG